MRVRQTFRQFIFRAAAIQSAIGVLLASPGCSPLILSRQLNEPHSFLKPVETSPESVTLEIFQVRLPAGDPHLAEQLWRSVDELRLQVDTRHELIRNGFRAGIVGGTLPDGLAAHMDLQSQQPEVSPERIVTGQNADPTVTRRVVQLNRKDAAAIHTADLQQRVHVLLSEDGGIRGNTYEQAEAVYSLRAEAIAGQRIAVELVPELHHGELRPRYVGGDLGMFLMSQSRKRNTFDGLTMHARLAPGEMLLVSCLHDASGSLGHAFHAQDDLGPSEYKLVLIRLLQAPCSEILAAVER